MCNVNIFGCLYMSFTFGLYRFTLILCVFDGTCATNDVFIIPINDIKTNTYVMYCYDVDLLSSELNFNKICFMCWRCRRRPKTEVFWQTKVYSKPIDCTICGAFCFSIVIRRTYIQWVNWMEYGVYLRNNNNLST